MKGAPQLRIDLLGFLAGTSGLAKVTANVASDVPIGRK
jgi:hypothetical protein